MGTVLQWRPFIPWICLHSKEMTIHYILRHSKLNHRFMHMRKKIHSSSIPSFNINLKTSKVLVYFLKKQFDSQKQISRIVGGVPSSRSLNIAVLWSGHKCQVWERKWGCPKFQRIQKVSNSSLSQTLKGFVVYVLQRPPLFNLFNTTVTPSQKVFMCEPVSQLVANVMNQPKGIMCVSNER